MAIIKHGAAKAEERQGDPNLNPLAEDANLVLAEAEGVALVIPDIEDAALLGPPPSEQLWAAYRGAGVASYVNAGWLFLNTIGAIFEFLFPHILVPAAEVAPAAETVSAPTAAPDIPVIALIEELEDLNQTGLKRTLYTGSAMIQLEEGSDEE